MATASIVTRTGRKRLLTLMLLLALGVAVGAALLSVADQGRGMVQDTTVKSVEVNYVTDVADPRRLVGLVDNVFVARVLSEAGTLNRDSVVPETLFNVEVQRNIKGSLSGTVIVNQQGGFSQEEGALILMENDPLLKPGQTYLFATKPGSDGNQNWHTVVPGYGDIPTKDANAQSELVRKYTDAFRQQIPFNPNKP